jgi:hypothetical protein
MGERRERLQEKEDDRRQRENGKASLHLIDERAFGDGPAPSASRSPRSVR